MNWEAIGAIGEIVGAIAVVATLVYLAVQTRHNAAATQSSAEIEASRQFAAWMTRVSLDETLQNIFDDVQVGNDLSDIETRKWLWYVAELFHMSEGIFFQYKKGFISIEVWSEFERTMLGILQVPLTYNWWQGRNSPLSDSFRDHIDNSMTGEITWKMPDVAGTMGDSNRD